METSTMQATKGGNMSLTPVTHPPRGSVGGSAAAQGADELRNPKVHEIEIGVTPRGAGWVRRDDHRLGACLLRHFPYLVPVVVVGGEQNLDVLLPHGVDYLKHVSRRRRDAGLGLDIRDAGQLVLTREIVPLLVIARERLAAERERLLEPSAQSADERSSLVLPGLEKGEQLALAIQGGEGYPAEQPHQRVAEQRPVQPIFEVLFSRREIVGILG